jgi:membrane protein YdbS with pleckstrin-like domain
MEPAALQHLDPRSVLAGRVAGWIFVLALGAFVVPAALGAIVTATAVHGFRLLPTLLAGLVTLGCVFTGLGLLVHVRPLWRYRHTSYFVDEYGIQIATGRFWHHTITVPHARVQHIDVLQGPLERRFGLATLVIYTAGTTYSAVRIAGLSHDAAVGLRERLAREKGLDAV